MQVWYEQGCTAISSISNLPSDFPPLADSSSYVCRHEGCCKGRSLNYPREPISTQCNRWCITYLDPLSSCKYLDSKRQQASEVLIEMNQGGCDHGGPSCPRTVCNQNCFQYLSNLLPRLAIESFFLHFRPHGVRKWFT